MKHLPERLLAHIILMFSVALLLAVGAWYLAFDEGQPSRTSLHLTQAEWQVSAAADWQAPAAAFDSKTLAQNWQQIALPASLSEAINPASDQKLPATAARDIRTIWIRFPLHDAMLPVRSLMLYGTRLRTEGNVALYANGQLIYRAQEQGVLWNSLFTPLWVALNAKSGGLPLQEILIRLEQPAHTHVGVSSLWLGSGSSLQGRYYARQWLQRELPATLSAAFLLVGIFSLFVWFKRRHELSYLLFFNIAVISFAGHLHYYIGLPIVQDWFAWLTSNALFWLIAILHLFLRQLHGRAHAWLTRAVLTIVIGISGLTWFKVLPYYPDPSILIQVIYGIAVLLAAIVSVAGIVSSWRRSKEGLLVAAGLAIATLLGMADWLLYTDLINVEGWFMGAYTNAITFALFGRLMYWRYVGAIDEVEQLNASLAQRLQEREAELEISHRQLREAELRQTISDERQRLMQDMHDGLGSSLISAIRSVERGGVSEAKVSQILKDCLDDLKLTIDSMEPVQADLLLLLATLRFRLEPRLEDTGIALRWEVRELPTLTWLDPTSALHILRIVQESISNTLRHTRANAIRVITAMEGAGVCVIIEDNGQGFDVDKALASAVGRGLHNQRRRAQALDGKISWESGPTGTRFTLWLPVRRAGVSA